MIDLSTYRRMCAFSRNDIAVRPESVTQVKLTPVKSSAWLKIKLSVESRCHNEIR